MLATWHFDSFKKWLKTIEERKKLYPNPPPDIVLSGPGPYYENMTKLVYDL